MLTQAVFPSPLYVITPDVADRGQWLALVTAALEAGAPLIQYRDKINPMPEKLHRARALAQLCQQHGARLIINDDLVLALACGADGVHLGGEDGSIRDARRLLPPGALIGASCYDDLALAQKALADGASYVAFGACFDSPTKPAARHVSTAQLEAFRNALGPSVPICGIGGITRENVAQLNGKVNAVALISELFGSPQASATPESVRQRVRHFIADPLAA